MFTNPINCAEHEIIHNETTQKIDPATKCATLIVISPDHGVVDYDWEFIGDSDACFPSNTGVLYVRDKGTYQCTVANKTIKFEVLGIRS